MAGVIYAAPAIFVTATKHGSDMVQASTKPVVVTMVDRPYRAGRHILNIQDLQARVTGKWPHAVVQVVHIEGLDLKQQIALFQHTSILIWTHGAAMADLLFLPQVPPPITITTSPCTSHYRLYSAVVGRASSVQLAAFCLSLLSSTGVHDHLAEQSGVCFLHSQKRLLSVVMATLCRQECDTLV